MRTLSKGNRAAAVAAASAVLLLGRTAGAEERTTRAPSQEGAQRSEAMETNRIEKSNAQWKRDLSAEQYRVLRQKGTERAFTGKYWNHAEEGAYRCAGCGQVLFGSDRKFDSGCGWPSFAAPAAGKAVTEQPDDSHGTHRTEVLCSRCGGHLGHVFDDGPAPTGRRYCINSAALTFEKGQTNAPADSAAPVPSAAPDKGKH